MKALIVDDNDIARTTLSHLAKQIPNLTVVNEYCNAIEAYHHLQENHIDLIFLYLLFELFQKRSWNRIF
ncbi:hypothetical protein AB9T88_04200 [Flavobacterium sp. LBUM151]